MSPARWPIAWIGALAAAATAALVMYVKLESPSEFSPRGSTPVAERSVARALCSRGSGTAVVIADATEGGCALGDRLAFVASARGHRYVAVALMDLENKVEVVVSGAEGGLAPGNDEEVLAGSTHWRAGLRVMAIYSDTPIDAAMAEKCVRGECPAPLEHREIPVERSKP